MMLALVSARTVRPDASLSDRWRPILLSRLFERPQGIRNVYRCFHELVTPSLDKTSGLFGRNRIQIVSGNSTKGQESADSCRYPMSTVLTQREERYQILGTRQKNRSFNEIFVPLHRAENVSFYIHIGVRSYIRNAGLQFESGVVQPAHHGCSKQACPELCLIGILLPATTVPAREPKRKDYRSHRAKRRDRCPDHGPVHAPLRKKMVTHERILSQIGVAR